MNFNRLIIAAILLTGCSSSPDPKQDTIDVLYKELRKAQRERDASRADYEADIIQAFRRETIDRRHPNVGMPEVPDWYEQKRLKSLREREAIAAKYAPQPPRDLTQTTDFTEVNEAIKEYENGPLPSNCIWSPIYSLNGGLKKMQKWCSGATN